MEEYSTDLKDYELSEIKAKHDIRHTLAIDRTILANERTMLSYTRTSLTLLVPGVSFVHFTDAVGLQILAWLFIPLGIFFFFYGYYRFYKKKIFIRKEREVLQQMIRREYCRLD